MTDDPRRLAESTRIARAMCLNFARLRAGQIDLAAWDAELYGLWRRAERRHCIGAVARLVTPNMAGAQPG